MRLFWFGCALCCFIPFGCQNNGPPNGELPDAARVQQVLEMSNKQLLAREEQAVEDFLVRQGMEMQQTGSGLRYKITESGEGPLADYARYVELEFSVYLLNGDLVYSSREEGSLQFRVGHGGAVPGLDEGVRKLNQGAKAVFVIPYHLAHGIQGDGQNIPARATIVYEVELINIL